MIGLGYDRDFNDLTALPEMPLPALRPAAGWECVELDVGKRVVRVPEGVVIDLGATAKAFAADRACARIAASTRSGVLVNLGGDIAVRGAPPDGWAVGLALDCATPPGSTEVVVAVREGGIATSGTTVRAWSAGGRNVHHIVDPRTGDSAGMCWKLVTVAAATCLEANIASTASIVWGPTAVEQLRVMGLPARLVREDGSVTTVNGWPHDDDVSTQAESRMVL
jgi:thiamine biosynthesis lipoprotein